MFLKDSSEFLIELYQMRSAGEYEGVNGRFDD